MVKGRSEQLENLKVPGTKVKGIPLTLPPLTFLFLVMSILI